MQELNTQKVTGCVFVFLYRAEAKTPPPLPTNAPFRMYLSNLSVCSGKRGKGIAKHLMFEAERLAALWGHNEILLHVKPENIAARELYKKRGYERLGSKRWWNNDELYKKQLSKKNIPFLAPDSNSCKSITE